MTTNTKILVVDDEEVVRLSHVRVLSGENSTVEAVWNAQEALRAMDTKHYDLVLLDVRMPGMDGMSLLKRIKEQWPEAEVIVITGYPEVESAKQAVKLGAYDYLTKPIGPDEVINAANGAMLHKRWALRRDTSATLQ